MRDASPPVSAEELDRWLVEANVTLDARDAARLRARLEAMRERIREATPQARGVIVRGYMRDLARAPAPDRARAFPMSREARTDWGSLFAQGSIKGIAVWVGLTLLALAMSRPDRPSTFVLTYAVLIPIQGILYIPCVVVLGGALHASAECNRARVRSGRAVALLVSGAAFALSFTILWLVLKALRCNPGPSLIGAVAVGLGGLAGIVSAENGRLGWKAVPEALTLAVLFGYLYGLSAFAGCVRW